ncbi:MAG: class I adenylate-forming enzyme family protein [Pseudonocardiaceae bacterium]
MVITGRRSRPPHLPALLAHQADAHARQAAVSVSRGAPLSYGVWWQRAQAASKFLRARIQPGGLIALPFPSDAWPEYCVAYIACQLAGGVPVPSKAEMSPREWDRLIDSCRIAHVVVPDASPALPPSVVSRAIIWPFDQIDRGYAPGSGAPQPMRTPVCDVAHVLFTSGTTGEPKAIAATHTELLGGSSLPPTWAGRTLVHVMGPAAAAGTEGAMLLALKSGLHATTVAPLEVASLAEKIVDPGTSVVLLTPSVAMMCIRSGLLSATVPQVKLVMLMGSATPDWVMRELTRYFAGGTVLSHYGATEAGAAQLLMPFDRRRPGAAGQAVGATEVRVTVDGRDVASGEVGEVLLRRKGVPQRSYLQEYPSSLPVFEADGWVHTGDLGYLDEDGYLYLLGRKKDIVVRGGQNIAPVEVEAELTAHPEVAEAAAFGVPHELWGEMLVAAVVLRETGAVTSAELRRTLRSQLAAFKVPSRIVMVDSLPRNDAGKVEKTRLREIYLSTAPVPRSESDQP